MMKNEELRPDEEKALMASVENEEWIPVENKESLIAQAKEFASSTMKKDKRMNIRIAERDLKNLKIKALEEGLPYQTLVSMILHKYVTGQLVDKENNVGSSA
jgi:predicted DNA binding CopG/RHH family protein